MKKVFLIIVIVSLSLSTSVNNTKAQDKVKEFVKVTIDGAIDAATNKHCISKAGGTTKCTWRFISNRPVCSGAVC